MVVRPAALRRPRRVVFGLLTLTLILAGLVPVTGRAASVESQDAGPVLQAAGLAMTVEAGYDGHYKIGEWFPVRVGLTNTGAAVEGEVQTDAVGSSGREIATYAYPVSLPAPSRKTITLYTYASDYQHEITVRLLRGSTVLLEQKAKIDPLNDAFLLGVVSDTPDLLNALSGTRLGRASGAGATTTVAHLATTDVPTLAPALAALDALVVANTDTGKWSPEQRAAVTGWAVAGGTLVVAGGANAGSAAGLADLLPAQMAAGQPVGDLSALGGYAGGTAPEAGGALASSLQLRSDISGAVATVVGPNGPLLAYRPLGQGAVFALALDPAVAPLRTWDRAAAFWQTVFADHQTGMSVGASRRTNNNYNSSGPFNSPYGSNLSPFDIPALQLPGVATIGVFLLVYVVVVGPFNWLILRRTRRTEWAWLTIPAIILLFAGLAYALGYGSKGNHLRLTTGTVVQTYPGASVATVNSFAALFSPNRQAYDLEWDAAANLSEVNEQGNASRAATLYTGRPSAVRDLQIDTWALRGFLAETSLPITAPFSGHLQLSTGNVSGRITNTGNAPLRDVAVVLGGEVQLLGTLAPGAEAAVQIASSGGSSGNLEHLLTQLLPGFQTYSYPPPTGAADRLRARKAALLTTGITTTPDLAVTVLGWADTQPLAVRVPGQNPVRDDLVLVTTHLPLDTAQGRIVLGPSLLSRTLVNANGQAQGGSPDFSDIELSTDTVFQYRLPADVTVDRLGLDYDLTSQYGTAALRLEAYNWDKATWDAAQDTDGKPIADHTTFKGNLATPATYVSKEGLLWLRLLPNNGASAYVHITRFDLSA